MQNCGRLQENLYPPKLLQDSGSLDTASTNHSKEQDRFLPIANVSRLMKKSLPPNAKVSKEAKEVVQVCVSEFINFITGEASDKCLREKRKTINGDDLLWAMTTLGFDNYVGPLNMYLGKYRDCEGEKTSMARQATDHDNEKNMSGSTATTTPINYDIASLHMY